MFKEITQHLICEYNAGCLKLPDSLIPIISLITGEKNSINDNDLALASSKIQSLIEMYNDKHPDAWKSLHILSNNSMFGFYDGYGDDNKTVAYLDALQLQITNILVFRNNYSYICKLKLK